MDNNQFIFISYSSKDKTVANAVCHYLEERGIPCWIAPRDIMPGETWAAAIVHAIRDCFAMVLIYSCESNTSHQVANEVDKAFSQAKTIIPFLVDSTPMCDELDYYLSRKHWLVAYPNYKEKLKPLAETLTKFFPHLKISSELVQQDNPFEEIDTIKRYHLLAEQGDAVAQYKLGCCYFWGDGVATNEKKGVKWLRMSAEQGYAEAQNDLGNCYYIGHGVALNYTEAVKWYKCAAMQGHSEAQENLSKCYRYGKGVWQSYTEAAKWKGASLLALPILSVFEKQVRPTKHLDTAEEKKLFSQEKHDGNK